MLPEYAFGNSGSSVIVLQVRKGYQFIQIHPADVIFHQDNGMIGGQLLDGIRRYGTLLIEGIHIVDLPLPEHPHKFHKNICRTGRIVHSPVMILQRNPQSLGHGIQFETIQ